ncbi:MAG: UTP--glucose-phosphate uridylyltransferase, partial [Solirubrobacteraceae bacterium]|nr:UTP--glucose-phosphate uridylyltransferase [Solirubrobacteraceae bacterium]
REATGARIPLVLMNSFATREASLKALAAHDGIEADVPTDFVQNKEPKVLADTLEPAEWPANPDLEWCPPGHGDLYTSLQSSGMLERLLDEGYRYAFVSNVDNLGAVLEPRILAWFADSGAPFASEAIDRTEADKKGGHLALRPDGSLVLREVAQTPEEDLETFQDTSRHRFFNANNLWIDLEALAAVLRKRGSVLGLPLIVNRKTVDPGDKSSTPVIQLETAMGAAIGVFDGAVALHVPRPRFLPVKTTDDLLVLRSDAYEITPDWHVGLAGGRERAPYVQLDSDVYKLVRDFEARFPAGPPSLAACEALTVRGDVTFGRDVVVRGVVELEGPRRLEDGEVLEGSS